MMLWLWNFALVRMVPPSASRNERLTLPALK